MKKENANNIFNSNEKWNEALKDANNALKINKLRASQLRNAIRIFKGKIATGSPWPEKKAGTEAESIPA